MSASHLLLLEASFLLSAALAYGCILLSALTTAVGGYMVITYRMDTGRTPRRGILSIATLSGWLGITGWISHPYREDYAAALNALDAQRPKLSDTDIAAALTHNVNPIPWAVETAVMVGVAVIYCTTTARRAERRDTASQPLELSA